jgi:CCAAT/enhancer binding protein (C/EBP) gamma
MDMDPDKRQLTTSDSEGSSLDENSPKYKRRRLEKGSDEYLKRRERNNLAVKKSREKSRQKAKETMDQVDKLRKENATLEQKVTILSKELGVLKDLFLAHAETGSQTECSSSGSTSNAALKSEVNDHEYSASSVVL